MGQKSVVNAPAASGGIGQDRFVERYGLWSAEQAEAAKKVVKLAAEKNVEIVRLSFADQHGILRGKSIVPDELQSAMGNGVTMVTTLLAKDTAHRTVYASFTPGGGFGIPEMSGAGDFIMVPDPLTFRVLPWAPDTGWMLCDIYFTNGKPVPFSTRQIGRDALAALAERGYDYVSGLEIEFHVFRLDDTKMAPEHATQPATPPDVSLLTHGFQYLTETRLDELDPVLRLLRRNLMELGLPLRTLEVEYGPSQVEITFKPCGGLQSADAMVLFRSAVKQVCRRNGYHASFMCRPALPNLFSSGWHLHQSLVDRRTGKNAFMPKAGKDALSPVGMQFTAGLLAHARPASVFTTPTINGYKRYNPYSLAPDRVIWGRDNRGVMVRAIGGAGDPGTRLENRAGEPAANPYLYMASQIISGIAGLDAKLKPPPPADTPYETEAPPLPSSLMEALYALREDKLFHEKLGDRFVDYILTLKEAEVSRYFSEVTDWEHREYFEVF